MNNLADEFRKSYDQYEILNSIGNETWQIKLNNYNKIAVLKKVQNVAVYEKLKNLKIKGVPLIYDIFQKDNENYVIEEFVNGSNLSSIISSKGKFSKKEVRNITIQLCDVLSEIHKAGIIHRDIKPSNILLTNDNIVYLIDFGIARNKNDSTVKDTRHLGTEFYASPEQYGFAQTDKKSDIYSVGKLMLVLLSAKETTENLKDIPYYKVISKCIEIDAAKRYSDAAKLKSALLTPFKTAYIFIAILFIILVAAIILIIRNSNTAVSENKDIKTSPEITSENQSEVITEISEITTTEIATTEVSENTTTEATTINAGSVVPGNSIKPKQTEKPQNNTATPTKPPSQSTNNNTAGSSQSESTNSKNDFTENTLRTDYNNEFGHVYYDGVSPSENPYVNVAIYIPKQANNINFAQGKTAKVYTEQTDKGLNITINGKSVFCANTNNIPHSPLENREANGRTYTITFYDFNHDGMKDIFVVEMPYFLGATAEESDVIYMSGFFIKVNSDLSMTLLGGDKLICQSGYDSITICPDHIMTDNVIGTTFVSYKVENDRVIKYNGI